MSFQIKPVFLALTVLCVLSLGHSRVVAQISKYHSSWVADERYENIQFKFTRQKDPGGSKKTELYKYAYKNNSSTDWRVSYEITGAGLKSPHIGAVIVRAGQNKSDSWTMFLDTDPGGELKSRVISLTELGDFGKRRKTIEEDFDELNSEVSPKEAKELSNKEISQILKDNQSDIKAFAKSALNKSKSSRLTRDTSSTRNSSNRTANSNPAKRKQTNSGTRKKDSVAAKEAVKTKPAQSSPNEKITDLSGEAYVEIGKPLNGSFYRVQVFGLLPNGEIKKRSISKNESKWSYSGNQLQIEVLYRFNGTAVGNGPKRQLIKFTGTFDREKRDRTSGKRNIRFSGTFEDTAWAYKGKSSTVSKKYFAEIHPDG